MLIVVHAAGEQAPCDPRILVSECDGDHICVTSLPHFQQPEGIVKLFDVSIPGWVCVTFRA